MRAKSIFLAFSIILAFNSCGNASSVKDTEFDTFEVQRGTNIAHWLSQSGRRGPERAAFFTADDVRLIADLGFDHIRLPIDEEQMWNEDLEKFPEAFELLHNAINWCEEEGLRVIVDLHIIRAHHFNRGEKLLWKERDEQLKFFDLWRDLSDELEKYSTGQVAYELMNEAVADDPEVWNKLINETVAVIREQEPERTIVIGSNRWQSVNTFDDLRIPENDPNILLSFHFYSPFALTHYKAGWTGIKDYDGPVQYPGQIVKKEDLEGYPEDLVNQLKGSGAHFTKDSIESLLQEPLAFAKKHDLPLYCGEFGVYQTAPREDALRWYDDMIETLEAHGIGWANWCYKGGFGIYEDDKVSEKLMNIFFQNVE